MQKNTRLNRAAVLPDGVDFLTLKECAGYLRINYFTFYRWIYDKNGPPAKQFSDRCIRIPKEAFLAWIETTPLLKPAIAKTKG